MGTLSDLRELGGAVSAAWATDVHWTIADDTEREAFLRGLEANGLKRLDLVLLTGDIGDGLDATCEALSAIVERLGVPVFFVLGNHDYYGAHVARARSIVSRLMLDGRLFYMTALDTAIEVGSVAYCGVDGWGDASYGDPTAAVMSMSDWFEIRDLAGSYPPEPPVSILRDLAHADADRLSRQLRSISERVREVVVLTHVPPWPGAAWHKGRPSDGYALPWFCCGATGRAIDAFAEARPDIQVTVYCGHTHSPGCYDRSANVTCVTGAASYGYPARACMATGARLDNA